MNSEELKKAIKNSGCSQRKLAKSLPMALTALNAKINGKRPMSIDEAIKISHKLNLSKAKFDEIFLDAFSEIEEIRRGR